jgi:hypothetical protein
MTAARPLIDGQIDAELLMDMQEIARYPKRGWGIDAAEHQAGHAQMHQ